MRNLPARAHRVFAADERSVAEARRFVRDHLDEWGVRDAADSAVLLVSELITNAVVHAGTTTRLELRLDQGNLRVDVEDRHPTRTLPMLGPVPSPDSEGGRGLLIISSLASAWGVEYSGNAKRVWLRIDQVLGPAAPSTPTTSVPEDGAARVGVVTLSPGTDEIASWNDDATALLGWTAAEVAGEAYTDLLDGEGADGASRPNRPRLDGMFWQGIYALRHRNGSTVSVFASHIGGSADMRGAAARGPVLLLVPAAHRALLERPQASPAPGRKGSEPLGLRDEALVRLAIDDYLTLAVERVRDQLSADSAYLLLVREPDDRLEVRALSGLAESLLGQRLDAHDAGVLDQRSSRLPLVVPDLAEREDPLLAGTALRSLVSAPLVVEGRVTGILAAASLRRDAFTNDDAARLHRSADTLAIAAERARLQTSSREQRGWLSFLAEASDLLAGSLDRDMIMAITGHIVVPKIATWCALHLDDERGRPVLQQVWHEDERLLDPLRAAFEVSPPGTSPVAGDPRLRGVAVGIPLIARGRRIGTLTLGRRPGRPFSGEILWASEAVARRAALAIDNARAHGDLQAVGRALQHSLLPTYIPEVPGLDIGVVYEAAGQHNEVGGDFYDVFAVGGGQWCFAIGDVCGTGAEAAAVTGLARHTLRALGRAGFPLADTLERLNAAILDEGNRARFLTLLYGRLRPRPDASAALTMISAGHPLPLVVRPGPTVVELGRPQMLLGVVPTVSYTAEEHVLHRGEMLVAVTDGVLERRAGARVFGDHGLATEVAKVGSYPAQFVADRVRRAVVDFAPQPQRDDMAVLVIRAGPEPVGQAGGPGAWPA